MRLVKFEKVHKEKYFNMDFLTYVVDKGNYILVYFRQGWQGDFCTEHKWLITYQEFLDAIKSSNPL